MMTDVKPRTNPASHACYFPPYGNIDGEFIKAQAENLIKWLWKGSQKPKEITYNFDCLLKIVDMVERRRLYYHIFHNSLKMSDSKEIALYCYWILKLQPFSYNCNSTQGNHVNAKIAYRVLLNAANAYSKHLPFGTIEPIMHSFRYHDLSKEAIIALCETWLK